MSDYETYIENCEDEIKIRVEFDYQPFEEMTRHYPGCSESVDVCYTELITETHYDDKVHESYSEICILPSVLADLETEILEHIKDEQLEYVSSY